ncbi:MAG TPA: RluA family pseudouridine synthase [Candidatus Saccharimonadales bacterium]|nr:RluA family pseudouridine synthase [Candidatus Saccharimonadales bacterium]
MIENNKRKRLDMYLAENYPDVSRSFLQRLCNTEQVLVNGKAEKSGFRLKPTDSVKVTYDMAAIEKVEDIDLPVLYDDDDLLVINKPAGIISHSRGKYWNEPSVASFVRQITRQAGERAGIVHRLDRATSGVMICAKNQAAMMFLQKQFADRNVKKVYRAIVSGHLNPQEAIIDMPIERNPKAPATFRVGSNGKPAKTMYKVLSSNDSMDELALEPATGRTHQLRVHLKHIGHPILGDNLYGGEPAERLFLHAAELTVKLRDGKPRTFAAPVPPEFEEIMKDVHG